MPAEADAAFTAAMAADISTGAAASVEVLLIVADAAFTAAMAADISNDAAFAGVEVGPVAGSSHLARLLNTGRRGEGRSS